MMSKPQFIELSRARIQPTRIAVISKATGECENKYTLGQSVTIEEGKRSTSFFVKGGIQIRDLEELESLRDAIVEAIKKETVK